jgi:uncharacterized protein YndB with AHSA1/START domain
VGTYTIRHEVGIGASREDVYRALTDARMLAGWWTTDTRGNGAKVNGVLEFWFGDFCQKFTVVELLPVTLVRWKAGEKDGSGEWAGTEITFSLRPGDTQCYVRFSHSGWREESGFFSQCSTKWAVFLLSLKDLLEAGKGHPWPHDVQINHD